MVYNDKMENTLFTEFIALSSRLRKEYPKSLGEKDIHWEEIFRTITTNIPDFFRTIYENVSGTRRNIQKQELFDFIPGYRLIHILELENESNVLKNMKWDKQNQKIIPFLANYSSDYICYAKMGKECVVSIMHDSPDIVVMHNDTFKFFETICAFYKDGVYYIDDDGYLDCDFDKQGKIGAKLNQDITYWTEIDTIGGGKYD